jgi:hypothetical protein
VASDNLLYLRLYIADEQWPAYDASFFWPKQVRNQHHAVIPEILQRSLVSLISGNKYSTGQIYVRSVRFCHRRGTALKICAYLSFSCGGGAPSKNVSGTTSGTSTVLGGACVRHISSRSFLPSSNFRFARARWSSMELAGDQPKVTTGFPVPECKNEIKQ